MDAFARARRDFSNASRSCCFRDAPKSSSSCRVLRDLLDAYFQRAPHRQDLAINSLLFFFSAASAAYSLPLYFYVSALRVAPEDANGSSRRCFFESTLNA